MEKGLGFSNFLVQLDSVGISVLVLLLALSVASWYLILTKGISNYLAGRRAEAFLKRFWSASSLQEVNSTLKEGSDDNAFAQLARLGMNAAVDPKSTACRNLLRPAERANSLRAYCATALIKRQLVSKMVSL